MICDSAEVKALDRRIAGREAALAEAADPRFRPALAAAAEAWRKSRDRCRADPYPQACMERVHHERIETLDQVANLTVGPRRFGDPLRGCWRRSETARDAEACLQVRLADARSVLEVAAGAVRIALAARDKAPGAAGDALALFETAQTAFAAHEEASCAAEAAALGSGDGRRLGALACRISAIRQRAVDILRFVPDLSPHWTTQVPRARTVIAACLEKTGPGDILDASRDATTARIRIATGADERQDCTFDLGAGAVRSVSPVPRDDMPPGEGLARYRQDPAPLPQPDCGLVEPVHGPDGALVGRLVVFGC